MTQGYRKISTPKRIPVPGNKLIEEYLGRLNTGDERVSVAHMIAPPGWDEPPQRPDFDEITLMLRGKMHILINDEEEVTLGAGEVILTEAGTKVQYSNPFEEENEYWAVCLPAFSPQSANRES